MALSDLSSGLVFRWVHGHNLVYNTCWEDPRLDRVALDIQRDDNILVITSAGCNALDYALCEPNHVYCVDMNFRQNALLELKKAGIKALEYDTFFDMFGRGRLYGHEGVYTKALRPLLPPPARAYWDNAIRFFAPNSPKSSFYFHGTSGLFARLINQYMDARPGMRESVEEILEAESIEQQKDIFYGNLHDILWTRFIRWAVGRDATLSLLGVPRAQRQYLEAHYTGGIVKFMQDCVESVFARLPLGDNYFWRVYLTGQYTHACCPEYLKEDNFAKLKDGLAERVTTHTSTVEGFLRGAPAPISKFVLLDHMDWLSQHKQKALVSEWQAIADRAAPQSRILWRSGGLHVDFVDPIEVAVGGARRRMGDMLTYHPEMAAELHQKDRVHTYGSFYIADMAAY